MSSSKRLVVIDGKSVFYRGYYAMSGLSTKDGVPTGGVYGFAVMALEVIKRLKPDYVCVAWDKPKTNIRKRLEIYPDYKAGRKPAPPDFYVQIPILHELLEALNWPLIELDDFEADDIMATLSERATKEGIETILVSSDMDMLQCLSPKTSFYVLKKGLSNIEHFNPESFEKKYGLRVDQFVDLKALKGDSSDNIPGVPGVGEKTALDLLKKYHTLEGVYENLWQISGSVAKKLEAGRDLAYTSKELVKLMTDAPVPFDTAHMSMENFNPKNLEEVLKRLEFRTLISQLPEVLNQANGDSSKPNSTTNVDLPRQTNKVASDSTTIFVHFRCHEDDPILPYEYLFSDGEKVVVVSAKSFSQKRQMIQKLLANKLIVGFNVKSLIKHLLVEEVDLRSNKLFDVQVAAFLHNSLIRDQSLGGLVSEYLEVDIDLSEVEQPRRALLECSLIKKLFDKLSDLYNESDNKKLKQLFDDIEMPVIKILVDMEIEGILINPQHFIELGEKLSDRISDLEQTIYGYADQEFNIASPQQLAVILFEKLALPTNSLKKGKGGSYSTAADVLEKLKDTHPIIDCIMQYRELTKLRNTYVEPLPKVVDLNHRIHTTFNITVAQTGRLSSTEPNLQNIPVRTELGRQIRSGFIAGKGNVFVSADYSQFELRLAAVLAGDSDMIEAFNSDIDIHTLTASQVFGVALEDVSKEMRYQAKAVNFGILYGQTPHGLAGGTGMTFAEARDFIDKYFAQRQPLLDYIEATRQKAITDGYVETLFGRRRPTPDVRSANYMVRESAFRQAVNMPIQGTEADLMKLAMIKLQECLQADKNMAKLQSNQKPKQILQIHDSIMVECREADANWVGKLMKETMENIYPEIGIKLKVDVSTGHNWGEL